MGRSNSVTKIVRETIVSVKTLYRFIAQFYDIQISELPKTTLDEIKMVVSYWSSN